MHESFLLIRRTSLAALLFYVAFLTGCGGGGGSTGSHSNAPTPLLTIGSQTQYATCIARTPDGKYIVADTTGNIVETYDSDGGYLSNLPLTGSNITMTEPEGLALDSAGNIYVGDTTNRRILKFDPSGNLILTINKGTVPQLLTDSEGITVDSPRHLLYVSDVATHRVEVFDSVTGAWVRNLPSTGVTAGTAQGQFDTPISVATDADGNLYVADSNNNRVQKFDGSGNFLKSWGTLGTGSGQFNHPAALAFDTVGVLYVYDSKNDRIQLFSQDGTWIKSAPVRHHGWVGAQEATGLVVEPNGRIDLVNFDTGKIDIYPPA